MDQDHEGPLLVYIRRFVYSKIRRFDTHGPVNSWTRRFIVNLWIWGVLALSSR